MNVETSLHTQANSGQSSEVMSDNMKSLKALVPDSIAVSFPGCKHTRLASMFTAPFWKHQFVARNIAAACRAYYVSTNQQSASSKCP
jgi:hypothetical protein